tara:strand:- start:3820 stop:5004 length:1185 start_codon:yes stop_codon:yes gene_type:complete
MLKSPLDGLTVVSLEQAVAAPFATRQLADLGARVIKIERPGVGDFARSYDDVVKGLSSHFVWLNRSKESLTLNLKRQEGVDVLRKLLFKADIFVQNLAPGATARMGLTGDLLRAEHPRLIVCNLSGYGTTGPYRNRKAYDLLVQAESGLISITGTAENPAKVGVSVADIAAGMYAYSGVLTALYTREQTGKGLVIEVSMFEALGEWLGFPLHYTMHRGTAPSRSGARHATIAPYGPFSSADGEVVYLGVQNEREWSRFCCEVLKSDVLSSDSRFQSNTRRIENSVVLDREIEDVFSILSGSEIVRRLNGASIANARLNSIEQFLNHEQLRSRSRWQEVDSSVGPLRSLIPPVNMEGVVPRMDRIPDLGEHTDCILGELSYDLETVAKWRANGIV